jgi:hypothetical protein
MADTQAADGIVTIPGDHSVDEMVTRLKQVLQAKAAKIFAHRP